MTKRSSSTVAVCVFVLGVCLGGALPVPLVRAQVASAQPNILFILTDNLGYGELGVYGGGATRGAPTPRLDTLAREGIRLTNMNMETQCTPSRSSLMTGRFAIRSGTYAVPFGGVPEGLTQWEMTHSTELRGEACHRSAKASRGEDLQVEEPVACGDCASLNFHATLAGMLSPTLIGDQVIEVRQPSQKRLLATPWVMKAFHREELPLDGVMGLIQQGTGHGHLRVGKHRIPARLLVGPALVHGRK